MVETATKNTGLFVDLLIDRKFWDVNRVELYGRNLSKEQGRWTFWKSDEMSKELSLLSSDLTTIMK